MRRINQILDIIKENKIVDGVFPIVKVTKNQDCRRGVSHRQGNQKTKILDMVYP